jgi:polysaccharide export outer membrane protein
MGQPYSDPKVEQEPEVPKVDEEYRLGPGDQIAVHVPFADEINSKIIAVDSSGHINVPFAGRIYAAGFTTTALEQELSVKLKPYFTSPNVTVNVVVYGSRPVSVLGAVRNPTVHQLRGKMTLVQILSASGGLAADAGSTLKITRQSSSGPLPLPNAKPDPSGMSSTAEVDLNALMAGNPAADIDVRANDIITIPPAKLIYVLGEVHKAGGFPLRDTEGASVLQALALAEGTLGTASKEHARILRAREGQEREEIDVNLTKILDHKQADISLKAGDILYVPNSKAKSAALRGVEAAIQMGTGVVIWGR